MASYKGFSTQVPGKKYRIVDFELVKQDLVNHFNIRRGEKLMNPDFGTIIWSTIFEPMSEDVKNLITKDVTRIIGYDPRIAAQSVIVTEYDRGLQIEVELVYISTSQIDKLNIQFDRESRQASIL